MHSKTDQGIEGVKEVSSISYLKEEDTEGTGRALSEETKSKSPPFRESIWGNPAQRIY